MADFMQTGNITTIHSLRPEAWEQLDVELRRWGRQKPLGLVLPALYSEFENPAVYHILEELQRLDWIERVVLVLSKASREEYESVSRLFASFPASVTVLWRESSEAQELLADINEAGFEANLAGKGRACWLGLGYLLAQGDCEVIAFQDCDIKTYHRKMLARLVAPLMAPGVEFEFSKAFYPRFSRRLNGRLTRLMVGPLLAALRRTGVQSDFLDFLGWFRYPLSGEIAFSSGLARTIEVAPDWGLEISTLDEVYRRVPASRVCQVDVSECYDHKHQAISAGDAAAGLHRMSREVAQAIFRGASADGAVLSAELLTTTLLLAYRREAMDAILRYEADAILNGLDFDVHAESRAVEVFAKGVEEAAVEFLADPFGRPLLPSWQRMSAGLPGIFARFESIGSMEQQWTEQATA